MTYTFSNRRFVFLLFLTVVSVFLHTDRASDNRIRREKQFEPSTQLLKSNEVSGRAGGSSPGSLWLHRPAVLTDYKQQLRAREKDVHPQADLDSCFA